ncbi:MAG: hypothetical protein RL689_77 [Planctomycetota bacterium]
MGRACGRQTKSNHSHCVVDETWDLGLGTRHEGRGHGAVEASESREMAKGQARGRRRPAAGLQVPAQWWSGRGLRAACTTPRDRRGRKRRSIRPSSRREAIGVGSGGVDGEDSVGIDIGGVQGQGEPGGVLDCSWAVIARLGGAPIDERTTDVAPNDPVEAVPPPTELTSVCHWAFPTSRGGARHARLGGRPQVRVGLWSSLEARSSPRGVMRSILIHRLAAVRSAGSPLRRNRSKLLMSVASTMPSAFTSTVCWFRR